MPPADPLKMPKLLRECLLDMEGFPRGYSLHWKPKSREKLQAMGLVEKQVSCWYPYVLTQSGKLAAAILKESRK
jgi:hypothetical protein